MKNPTPDNPAPFAGFPRDALAFFAGLKKHNDKAWFERHKADYAECVLAPAAAFVRDMGHALGRLRPAIVADPSPSGSIFRIHRDTRFSNDKTPYKTHLGILFWHNSGKKLERPGFYFELDDAGLRLYCGSYLFDPPLLEAYREALFDEDRSAALRAISRKLEKAGLTLGGEHYKRLPRGCDTADPLLARLLRHNTLYTEEDCGRPNELSSAKLISFCLSRWKPALPLFDWLVDLTLAAQTSPPSAPGRRPAGKSA